MTMPLYPVLLDISRKRILIVGGGAVAARKARGILDGGASDVLAVAPDFCDSFPQGVRRIQRKFEPGDLAGVSICFAATDTPEVNAQIAQLCAQRSILVNRADRDGTPDNEGDFTVPAVHRSGAITLAVSAAGAPAISAAVRTDLAGALDGAWGEYAAAMNQVRRRIVESGDEPGLRTRLLRAAATREALQAFKTGGVDAVLRLIDALRAGS